MRGVVLGLEPVLEYRQFHASRGAMAVLRASWMVAGSVAHGLVLGVVLLLAGILHDPFLLVFLPIALVFASAASAADRLVPRCLGQGAIFGGLFLMIVGYGVGSLVLTAL